MVASFGPDFVRLSPLPFKSASISRLQSCDMSLTTLFSLTEAAVVQLLARSASYPCLFVGLRQCPLAATYPAPGSFISLVVSTFFPECVSRFPASSILLTSPPALKANLRFFCLAAGRHPLVCMLPLSFSLLRASWLPTYPTPGSQLCPASSGGHLRSRFNLALPARLRSPPSFRSHEHPFRVGPFSASRL